MCKYTLKYLKKKNIILKKEWVTIKNLDAKNHVVITKNQQVPRM